MFDGFGDEEYFKLGTPPIEAFRKQFSDELTPQNPPRTATGLIATDGTFYACEWAEHASLALILCEYSEDANIRKYWPCWTGPRDADNAKDFLISTIMGWLMIGNQEDKHGRVFISGRSETFVTKQQRNTVLDIVYYCGLKHDPLADFRPVPTRHL